jgi:hypothetical protein
MNATSLFDSTKPHLVIRVHLTDGSTDCFTQDDEVEAKRLWDKIQPAHLFVPERLVLVGKHSKAVYVTGQVTRVDFIQKSNDRWDFPAGYSDIVELSEENFRKHAHLDDPEMMPKRNHLTPVDDLLVSFLKLRLAGGKPLFLMVEAPAKLPIENHSFMQFLLSKGAFHMRLSGGGIGVVNLANLLSYAVYPGISQTPADSWFVEPVLKEVRGQYSRQIAHEFPNWIGVAEPRTIQK